MNIAVAFLADKMYIKGCQVAAYSFIKNNSWFDGDMIVYLSEDILEEDKLIFGKFYHKVKFKPVKTSDYYKLLNSVNINKYLIKAFYKFEVFGEEEYDKVIFIDSDITVIGDIREVLEWGDFTVTIDTEMHDTSFTICKRSNEYVNTGFFVIGKKYLSEKVRKEIIDYAFNNDMSVVSWYNPWAGAYADQCVISSYFADNGIDVCSNIYNQKFYYFKEEDNGVVKLIHYCGDNKPWIGRRINDNFWWDCYLEIGYDEYRVDVNGEIRFYQKDNADKDKYIVCACAKSEDDYIEEWVKHYLKIGFDKIIIADNNDDSSILPKILLNYIENQQVQILNCGGLKNFQLPVYTSIVNAKNYQWIACFDADEFLEVSPQYKDVKEMLADIEGDCMLVNWMMFNSNGQIQRKHGGVQERFKTPISPVTIFKENMFFKPIIKNTAPNAKFTSSHEPIFETGGTYNIGGYYLTDMAFQVSYPIRYKKAYLKHYYTKSFDEYLQKVNRGWPDNNDTKKLRNMGHYFFMNGKEEMLVDRFTDHIFSDGGGSWTWDILNEYDVIAYKLPTKNYFSLLYYLSNSMERTTDHTFILEEDVDDNIYNILLEIAIRTGNRLIAAPEANYNWWNIYEKCTKGLGEAYYIITLE